MNPSRQFYTDILLYTFWSPAEINIYRSYSDPQYTYTLYIYHPPLYTSCWPYPVVYTYKNSCPYPAAIFVSSPHRVISYGTSITHLWLFWPRVRTDGNSHHHQHSGHFLPPSPSLQEIRQRPRWIVIGRHRLCVDPHWSQNYVHVYNTTDCFLNTWTPWTMTSCTSCVIDW